MFPQGVANLVSNDECPNHFSVPDFCDFLKNFQKTQILNNLQNLKIPTLKLGAFRVLSRIKNPASNFFFKF